MPGRRVDYRQERAVPNGGHGTNNLAPRFASGGRRHESIGKRIGSQSGNLGTVSSNGRPGVSGLRDPEPVTTSGGGAFAGAVGRVPVSRRRTALVLVPAIVAVLAAGALYVRGGDRLSGSGGSVTGPVTIGEEFHTLAFLDTGGGTIELVSAMALGSPPGLQVDVSLVDMGSAPSLGSSRGPLDARYRVVDLAGHRLRTSSPDDLGYQLDIRLIATTEGIHQVRAVAVTYRAGFLRERTAVLAVPVCLSASADWKSAPEVVCPLPDSAAP